MSYFTARKEAKQDSIQRGGPAGGPAGAGGTAGAPLGNDTKSASIVQGKYREMASRKRRYALQRMSAELLPSERVAFCSRHRIDRTTGISVWYNAENKTSHFGNLMLCGSVWTCPVCAAKITERRAQEVRSGVSGWRGSVFMATFTIQHSRCDKLVDLKENIKCAFRALKSGRWWQCFSEQYQIAGSVSSFEITWGQDTGWHPHFHVLFFSHLGAQDIAVSREVLQDELNDRYIKQLVRIGRSGLDGIAVKLSTGRKEEVLGRYVSKWGLVEELVKSPVKLGRGTQRYTPFQLLMLVASGDMWAGSVFKEYAAAMKGTRQLVWTRGLRDLLGLTAEKSDEELAADIVESGDELVLMVEPARWRRVVIWGLQAELLDLVEKYHGQAPPVRAWLLSIPEKY